jgi:hypothetical protein
MPLRCIAQAALATDTDTPIVDGTQVQPLHLKSVTFCERGGVAATLRFWLRLQGATTANKQYIFYNLPIVPSDSITLALDIGMLPGDILMARANTANVSVNLFAE